MIKIWTLGSFLSFILNLFLGLLIIIKSHFKLKNLLLAFVTLTLSLWHLGGVMFSLTDDYNVAFFWWKIGYVGTIPIPIFYCHFIIKHLNKKNKKFLIVGYTVTLFFIILNLFLPDLFLGNLRFVFDEFYWHDWVSNQNILFLIFYIFCYWIILGYSFYVLINGYRKSRSYYKNQLRYFLLASIIGWLGGHLFFLIDFGFNIYPISVFFTSLYTFILAYAILKYRLMDIRIVIARGVIFVVVYSLVLLLPFYIGYVTKSWFYGTLSMFILASTGPFLFNLVRKGVERRILFEDLQRYATLQKFARDLSVIRDWDVDKLIDLILLRLIKTMRISYGAIYLLDEEGKSYVLRGKESLRERQVNLKEEIDANSEIVKFIMYWRRSFLYEDVQGILEKKVVVDNKGKGIDYSVLSKELEGMGVSLVIPHFLEDNLVGFLFLGDKLSSRHYTFRDIEVLSGLAYSGGLAIMNGIYMVNLKKTQEELSEAQRIAQLGYLASDKEVFNIDRIVSIWYN